MKRHLPAIQTTYLFILALLLLCGGRVQAQINRVEYFIDSDPGFGAGTGIPISSVTDIPNQTASINLVPVANGFHNLFLRSRDVAGKWSVTNQVPFFKTGAVANGNVTRVEYFFDTDPGFGQATAISTGTGSDLANQSATIDLTPAANGFHNLFIRSQNASGLWSITNQVPFYKTGNFANGSITRVEYFLDTDPGFGQATAITTGTGSDLANQSAAIDLTTAANGFHNLFIRSQNVSGLWSISNQVPFFKIAAIDSPNIVRSEYYIDADPGFGLASPLIINPALKDVADKIVPINISCQSIGAHRLFVRSLDANGKWSITNTNSFDVAAVAPQAILVTSHNAPNTICNGSSFSLTYDGGNCAYTAGNVFNVEISNGAGIFAAIPPVIGTLSATAKSGTLTATLPFSFSSGTYKLRVSSTAPAVTGTASAITVTIVKPATSAITGAIDANLATIYPYSVANTTGSTYAWIFSNATQNTGGTGNSVSATFNVTGTQSVSVTETNQFGCVGDAVSKNIVVYQLGITNIPTNLNPCPGTGFTVNFGSTGVYDAGNIFTAQLSDAVGNFASPVNLGTTNASPTGSNVGNSINVTLPANTADGTGYRVRIISNSPVFNGSNSAAINVTTSDVFTLTQNVTVIGNLNLAEANPSLFACWRGGKLVLGNFNLTINGNILGFNASNFVVTNGNGILKLVNANSTNTYPVGTSISSPNFVRLNNTGTPDNFSVSVKEGVLRDGNSGTLISANNVNRTWNITEEVVGGNNATVTLLWNAADELSGFNRANCALAHYNTGPDWELGTASNAVAEGGGQFSQSQGDYTFFSPFTVTNGLGSPLPVHSLTFSAKLINNIAAVQWQTSSEAGSSYFEVQRSINGVSFDNIGKVQAAGYSITKRSYAFNDANVLALNKKVIYYRLQQVDKNGATAYSSIVKINLDDLLPGVTVYPNPVKDIIKLQLTTTAAKWLVTIFDANGRQAGSHIINAAPQIDIRVSHLAAGAYFMRISDGNKQYAAKFIIQ